MCRGHGDPQLQYSSEQLRTHRGSVRGTRLNRHIWSNLRVIDANIVRTTKRGLKGGIERHIPRLASNRKCFIKEPRGVVNQNLITVQKRDNTINYEFPTLMNSNARSLTSKIDELDVVLENNDISIAGLAETWLSNNVDSSKISIKNYSVIRKDRHDRRGGGVALYLRNNLSFNQIQSESPCESLWVSITPRKLPRNVSSIILGMIYHPPDDEDHTLSEHITSMLDQYLLHHPGAGIIIMGDFNQYNDQYIRNAFKLKQIVTKPTRDNNILDKVFTNLKEYYYEPLIQPPLGLSDHMTVVSMPLNVNNRSSSNKAVLTRLTSRNRKAFFAQDLNNVRWQELYQDQLTCSDQFEMFSSTLNNLMNTHFPLVASKRNSTDKPWITDKFRRDITARQKALASGNMTIYRWYRNKVNRTRKKLRKYHYTYNVDNLKSTDPSKWWSSVKSLAGCSSNNRTEMTNVADKKYEGNIIDLTSDLNFFFQSISSEQPTVNTDIVNMNISSDSGKYSVSVDEVLKSLLCIKINKAIGPDDIPNWILRDYADILCKPICSIFNASFREGYIPVVWKSAYVTPIPKKIPVTNIHNDIRPISLTPVLAKCQEAIMVRWLWDIITPSIDKNQFGGVKGRSTTHALVSILNSWFSSTDDSRLKKYIHVLFVDYSKAFDRVDPNIVLQKLFILGVPPILLRWIACFLSDRIQCVKIASHKSEWINIWGNVPQGTLLGIVLFLVLINDADSNCKFVDDSTLFSVCTVGDVTTPLQTRLNHLSNWSTSNGMKINVSKTKEMVIHFGKSDLQIPHLTIYENAIEKVNCFKLLGVYLSNDLKFADHVNYITSKASKRLYSLITLKRCGMSSKDLVGFYKTTILSILDYASPAWSTSISKKLMRDIETIQRRALKIIYGNDISYKNALQLSGLDIISIRYEVLGKKFFQTIASNKSDSLHCLLQENTKARNTRSTLKPFKYNYAKTNRCNNSFVPYALKHWQ